MVASRLTSSLPEEDRLQLFKSLNVTVDDDDDDNDDDLSKSSSSSHEPNKNTTTNSNNPRTSIGEAVAVIEATEAAASSKQNILTEAERQSIWEKAEKAAMERVQSDLSIQERRLALDRWKSQLEAERQNDLELLEKNDDPQQQQHDEEEEDDTVEYHQSENTQVEKDVHPVLGPVLIDLGYKRIHITTARALSAVPVWEKQSVYRHDRAKLMATDKLKTLELGLPGIIALHESKDGQLAILDGQHRVGMMTILEEKILIPDDNIIDLDRVLVEVFPQPSSLNNDDNDNDNDNDTINTNNHAQEIFTEINKAEPVKLLDMPGIAKLSDRRIIDGAASTLLMTYPTMFKPSQKCRVPHLNVDNLRDAIFAAGVLKRHGMKSQKALVKWMMDSNEKMEEKYRRGGGEGGTAWDKARKHEFYLGLDMAWLYD